MIGCLRKRRAARGEPRLRNNEGGVTESMADENGWTRVAARDEIKQGEIFATEIGDTAIALTEFDGQIHAVSDACTHEFALLSEGFLEEAEIECPLHQARFDMRTGACLVGPATQDLDTYEVKVEGEDVYVKIK
jgi:nitrite reductase/ring-hydroxylating ferredoxin subunit